MATSAVLPRENSHHENTNDITEERCNDVVTTCDSQVKATLGLIEEDERKSGMLPDEFLERAKKELREEPGIRDHALKQMRHFIEKHPSIRRCRTDTPFLLRFLRTKKFSVPQACSMLERYLTIRQQYPAWFQNLDPLDPKIAAVIDAGYLVPLPGRDSQGRRIILSCADRFDPYLHDSAVMARVHGMMCELLLDEPRSQLAGYTHLNDERGLSMPHLTLWSLSDIRTLVSCIQNSTPMRHKQTHFINIPSYANKLIEFAVSLLSDKLKNRIIVHRSIDELKQHIDPSILPLEYGGTIPLQDIIDETKRCLLQHRLEFLSLDNMYIELNSSGDDIKEHAVVASFRSLNLD